MLALNRTYTITMLEEGGEGLSATGFSHWQPVEVEMPVVKFKKNGETWILNLSSPRFVSAQEDGVVE